MVLWHVEVEGQRPAEVAPLLGVKANAVSALAYRAREGLRAAYLNMHTPDDLPDEECRWVHEHLGGYVRDSLSERDTRRVREHLDVCVVCSKSYLELASVNSEMRALIGPVVLGGAAAAYLGGGKAAGGLGLASARSAAPATWSRCTPRPRPSSPSAARSPRRRSRRRW